MQQTHVRQLTQSLNDWHGFTEMPRVSLRQKAV